MVNPQMDVENTDAERAKMFPDRVKALECVFSDNAEQAHSAITAEALNLPCFHCACSKDCIIRSGCYNLEGNLICCKTCTITFEETDLKPNLLLREMFSDTDRDNNADECEFCIRKNPSQLYCKNCKQFLCSECVEYHKRMVETHNHSFMKLETVRKVVGTDRIKNIEDAFYKNLCNHEPRHLAKFATLCTHCWSWFCAKCDDETHKNHEVKSIHEFHRWFPEYCNVTADHFKRFLEQLPNMCARIDKRRCEIKNLIQPNLLFAIQGVMSQVRKKIDQKKRETFLKFQSLLVEVQNERILETREIESMQNQAEQFLSIVPQFQSSRDTILLGNQQSIQDQANRLLKFIQTKIDQENYRQYYIAAYATEDFRRRLSGIRVTDKANSQLEHSCAQIKRRLNLPYDEQPVSGQIPANDATTEGQNQQKSHE